MNKAIVFAACALVTACGGGGGGGDYSSSGGSSSSTSYTVGGTVSGLNGTVVLQNNASNNLTITANGAFTFPTPLSYTAAYNVTVLTQPAGQNCTVANGAGAYPGMSV